MSTSLNHISAVVDQFSAQMQPVVDRLCAEARRNGKLEAANEVLQWFVAHRQELPQHLRDDFAQLILRTIE